MKTDIVIKSAKLDAVVQDMKNTQTAISLLLNELLVRQASLRQSDCLYAVEEDKTKLSVDSTEADRTLIRKLSYSFRATLTPILGWSEILLTNETDAETTRKALQTIKRQAEFQVEILNELETNL